MFAAAVATAAMLAGCLGGPGGDDEGKGGVAPPEARFDVLPAEEVWVPSSVDGKRLNNAVYRPDTDAPAGVFINFSPYWGDTAVERGDPFARYMIDEYVPRGFAVVLSAVRGTGHSEGCFQIAGDLELRDTHDVVAHFADAPWSNGRVAAGGKSYDSTSQNGVVAKFPHEALRGIFHVSGISDMYAYNYRNGVVYGPTQGTVFNTAYYGQTWHEYGLPLPVGGGSPGGAGRFDEDPESLARIIDDVACAEMPLIHANGIGSAAAGAKTDYWLERDWTRTIADSSWRGNVFFVHGFQDWNVKPDHILPWMDLIPEDVPRKVWLHQDTENIGHVYPMRDDWNRTMLAWLDHTLNGADNGFFDGPAYELEGSDGLWRQADAWPAGGDATTAAAEGSTITLRGPLRIMGAPALEAHVTASMSDPVFTAVMRGPDGTWINEAVLRVAYRDGLEEPAPVTPGEAYHLQTTFYPMDLVLADGEETVIELQADPRLVLTTAAQVDGLDVSSATLQAATGPLEPADVQPAAIDCFAC